MQHYHSLGGFKVIDWEELCGQVDYSPRVDRSQGSVWGQDGRFKPMTNLYMIFTK